MKPDVEWVTEFPKEDGSYWVKKPTGKIEGPFEVHHEKIWLVPFVAYPSGAIPDNWAFLRCDPDDEGKAIMSDSFKQQAKESAKEFYEWSRGRGKLLQERLGIVLDGDLEKVEMVMGVITLTCPHCGDENRGECSCYRDGWD